MVSVKKHRTKAVNSFLTTVDFSTNLISPFDPHWVITANGAKNAVNGVNLSANDNAADRLSLSQ
jgi:hypothetical protein